MTTARLQRDFDDDVTPPFAQNDAVAVPIQAAADWSLPNNGAYVRVIKPLIDRFVGAILLVILSPVAGVAALLVWRSLGRPIILRQDRVGLHGRVFQVYKFRSMHPDRRHAQLAVGRDRRLTHKHPHDPRLVAVGRFLRKWSLDELPQLLNVVRGEMSLVGPRPELVSVVASQYAPWQHARHRVKPGLTGLWQVTERDNGDEMYKHTETDLRYVQQLSFWIDTRILVMTIPAVLGLRRGF